VIHRKLTPERMRLMRVVQFPLPDMRAHVSQDKWLRHFPESSVGGVTKINTMIVCTRNKVLLDCSILAYKPWEEFLFIDGDVEITPASAAFWESDADVVCCKAPMQNPHSWEYEGAWHDPMWRCKAKVLQSVSLPFYQYTLDNLGTKELKCICQGFADKCRAAGFSVDVSGECGHQNVGSWQTTGCKHRDFGC